MAARLAVRGALVIDADLLAREVVEPGTGGLARIVSRFGPGVLTADGRLDRARLGAMVFADPDARRDLEGIVHPLVRQRGAAIEAAAGDVPVVVHVIPLLVETGQAGSFDVVVVVDVDERTQLDRIMRRDGLDARAAAARLAAQASRQERLAVADEVVVNDGDLTELRHRADLLWERLVRLARAREA